MGDVINMKDVSSKPEVLYAIDGDGGINEVSHTNSIFSICHTEGGKVALKSHYNYLLCDMDKDEFNEMILSWLLISDPKSVDSASLCEVCDREEHDKWKGVDRKLDKRCLSDVSVNAISIKKIKKVVEFISSVNLSEKEKVELIGMLN